MPARPLLALLFLLGLACAGVDAPSEPEAVPAVVAEAPPEPEEAPALAFEGLYVGKDRDGTRFYYRFYEDGHVSQVGSTGAPEKVANWLGKSHQHSSQGAYQLDGKDLKFSSTSPSGTVDFVAKLSGDTLELKWHSHINDADGEDTARYTPLELGAE